MFITWSTVLTTLVLPGTAGFSHWMESNAFIWKHFWVCVFVCVAAELWNQQRVRWSVLCVRGRTCLLACRQALLALSTPRQHTASSITPSCSVDLMNDFNAHINFISSLSKFDDRTLCCVSVIFCHLFTSKVSFLVQSYLFYYNLSNFSFYPLSVHHFPSSLLSTHCHFPFSVPPGAKWDSLLGVKRCRPTALRPPTH